MLLKIRKFTTVSMVIVLCICLFSGCINHEESPHTSSVSTETSSTTEATTIPATTEVVTTISTTKPTTETTIETTTKPITTRETTTTETTTKETTSIETTMIKKEDIEEYLYEKSIKGWVYSSSLNVRKYPSEEVINTISNKKEVTIVGEYGDYYLIDYGSKMVSKKYIIKELGYSTSNKISCNSENLIGSATTILSSGGTESRNSNIRLSANSCNLVIPEGGYFSFNAATGPRTVDRGYKKANVLSNGKYVQGYGGGVCQTSTTVHCAILNANENGYNFSSIKRKAHGIPATYVDSPEKEATVSWGEVDFSFVNSNNFDVAVKAYMEENDGVKTITIEIYKM